MRTPYVAALLVLFCLPAVADAHPHPYINTGAGDARAMTCQNLVFGLGETCVDGSILPAGEVQDGFIRIEDQTFTEVSFLLCQDAAHDGNCSAAEDRNTTHCGEVQLFAGLDWNTDADLYVFLDGPVFGNPVLSDCGLSFSMATIGQVVHN